MKVIKPLEILDANFVSSSISENDYPEWNSGETVAPGLFRMRSVNGIHKNFKALVNTTAGVAPESNAAMWLDSGSTNRWRMLRTNSNIQSTATGSISATVQLTERATAVAVSRMDADIVTISSNYGYSSITDLRTRNVSNWQEYFFKPFTARKNIVKLDLFYSPPPQITIKLEKLNGGLVSCGPIIIGTPIDLGLTQYNADRGNRDFSGFDRNVSGDANFIARRNVPTVSTQSIILSSQVDTISDTLDAIGNSICLWLGVDDFTQPQFNMLYVLGVKKNYKLSTENYSENFLSLDLEGY